MPFYFNALRVNLVSGIFNPYSYKYRRGEGLQLRLTGQFLISYFEALMQSPSKCMIWKGKGFLCLSFELSL